MNAFGLDTGDYKVIRDFIENFTEYFKNKKVEISGILQLSKSGQQKLEDGCILLATHQYLVGAPVYKQQHIVSA